MVATTATETGDRDGAVIAIVAAAHYCSHLMALALPPLFPILHRQFGVSFEALAIYSTLFYVASGLGQASAGVLVDRVGAHWLQIGGLLLLALGIGGVGLVTRYWMMLPLAVVAGLGNSVFHPADLSILSHRISDRRLGRAFSVHGIAGSVGFATPPILVTGIAAAASWRLALFTVAAIVLAVAAVVYFNRHLLVYRAPPPKHASHRGRGYLAVITSPVLLVAFAYFVLSAFGGSGLQSFSVAAFNTGYGFDLNQASAALTAYLIASAAGTALGGVLADRTHRHHRVAMLGMFVTSAMILTVGFGPTAPSIILMLLAIAGFASGVTGPSRDIIIRRAAAGSGTGSVFGFVYSGFDLGSSIAPLLLASLIDRHATHLYFAIIAAAFLLAVPTVMQVQHRSRVASAAAE